MGLLKAGAGALGGVLADSWRDYFYCDALNADTLVVKGMKRTSDKGRSSNTKGESNIISDGSIIAVADGQYMIIVEQGAIVDACGEPGEFVFDNSSEPSLFFGDDKITDRYYQKEAIRQRNVTLHLRRDRQAGLIPGILFLLPCLIQGKKI